LWNVHHNRSGDKKFKEEAKLEITYKIPEFPVDPKTKKEDLMMEAKLLDTGDTHIISKLYPHMSEVEIKRLIKKRRKDYEEQTKFKAEIMSSTNIDTRIKRKNPNYTISEFDEENDFPKPKIDNRAKHSEDSSKQPGKNGDIRSK
jgi:hypothetical protein